LQNHDAALDAGAVIADHRVSFSAYVVPAFAGLVDGSGTYVKTRSTRKLGSTWRRYSESAKAPLKQTSVIPRCLSKNPSNEFGTTVFASLTGQSAQDQNASGSLR
jgi:hypothetical protein